jgi:hypothetical protein
MPIEKVEVVVTTSSQEMQYNNLPPAQPPKITMNGQPVGQIAQPPYMPTGWQMLILDPTKDMKTPAAVLSNAYIQLTPAPGSNSWMSTYQYMYNRMVRQSLVSGNYEQQILIVASFGLDANTPPTSDALHLLLDFGAGSRLQYWETHCDVGSQVGNNTSWTSFPANYIFVGSSSWSYGQGAEIFERQSSGNSVQSTLTTTLSNFTETG